ncbi:MAG: hypothetical protein ACLTST_07345 [Lachnospiraceae bacterium]
MLDTIDSLYQKYNVLIDENEYGIKYDIPHAHMFVIEGMEKVRDVIEKNRKRKLTKHKKLSNNTIIEIDNCSPLEILKLQKNLLQIAEQEHITFVYGKGKENQKSNNYMRSWKPVVNVSWAIKNASKSWGKIGTVIPKQIWKLHL